MSLYLFILFTEPSVQKVVLDFERASWSSLGSTLPHAQRQGCAFHFTQALMKQINQLGLSPQFSGDGATKDILKELMALCYIPAYWIPHLFEKLKRKCTTPKLQTFAEYMQTTWVENNFISPEMWSVFGCSRRTNNTLEGNFALLL